MDLSTSEPLMAGWAESRVRFARLGDATGSKGRDFAKITTSRKLAIARYGAHGRLS